MTAKKNKNNLVWIDLEMTGLDPKREKIIEIATIITDQELNVLAEGPNLIIHVGESVLRAMDEWNQKQHGRSGLIEAVRQSKITTKQAETETLEFIKEYCIVNTASLCGNAVYHDRRFLIKYMPLIHEFLHYRLVDVSTIKGLVARWYPEVRYPYKKKESHRALSDIQESIEELKYYRANYFLQPEVITPKPPAV